MDGSALVLNAAWKQSLVAIRCLGRRDLSVTAGSYRWISAGGLSKYADRTFAYPMPWERPEAFVDALVDEVHTHQYDALLLSDDATAEAVVRHRDRLAPHVGLPYPDYGTLRVALDKQRTMEAAREFDVSHPTTISPDSLDREAIESALSYPIVLKPRKAEGRQGVHVCDSFAELERVFADVRERHGSVLIQEYVPNGGEVGVYTLYDRDSDLRAATVQERVRSFPPEGGASTCRKTIEDSDLLSRADDLLSALNWQGVAMAEFRVDPRNGDPKLLEINPRLWGSLSLSVAAGVDFPHLLYQLGAEGRCGEVPTYRSGVYGRHTGGELAHVFARPNRLRAAREVLRPQPGPCSFDILSWDDPLPLLGYVTESAHAFVQ